MMAALLIALAKMSTGTSISSLSIVLDVIAL